MENCMWRQECIRKLRQMKNWYSRGGGTASPLTFPILWSPSSSRSQGRIPNWFSLMRILQQRNWLKTIRRAGKVLYPNCQKSSRKEEPTMGNGTLTNKAPNSAKYTKRTTDETQIRQLIDGLAK